MPVAVPPPRKQLLSRLGEVFHLSGKKDPCQSSPVPHLLKFNIPPTEEERQKVDATLSEARLQVISLREELGQISADGTESIQRRTKLQNNLNQVESFIEKHQSILSLLRSLPEELLALIFIHCLPKFQSRAWGHRTWGYNPSFRLSQVCRRWRQIALNESCLWVILGDVHLTVETSKVNSTYLQFLEELLRRSKNMDLWIFVYCLPHEVLPMGSVHPVVDILVKHEKRWRVLGIQGGVRIVKAICEPTLTTTGHTATWANNTADIAFLSFPRLRKLDLDIQTRNQGNQIVGFSRAPALTEVVIAGTYPLILLPLRQLRVYSQATNGGRDIDDPVSEVIKAAGDLERLELIGEQTVTLTKRSTLDNLKTLHIRLDNTRQNIGDGLLDNLVLPKLEELKVASYALNVVQALSSLVNRTLDIAHNFPLRKLTLRQIHPPAGTLLELLKVTPHLEELVVEFPAVSQVLELLNSTKNQESPVVPEYIPRLRQLVVYTYPKNVDENEEEIGQLAETMTTHTSTNSANPHGTGASPALRLIFSTRDSAHYVQVTLNKWGTLSEDQRQQLKRDKFLSFLQSLRSVLEVSIPELKADRFTLRQFERPPPKRKHDLGFSKRLDGIMREIEGLDILEADVPVLYLSKLHLCLHRLSKLCQRDIYGDEKHNFRARAHEIVKKWSSLISVNLRSMDIRWALMGARSLIYIPQDDSSQKSVDVILGLYDCSDHEDTTWSDLV